MHQSQFPGKITCQCHSFWWYRHPTKGAMPCQVAPQEAWPLSAGEDRFEQGEKGILSDDAGLEQLQADQRRPRPRCGWWSIANCGQAFLLMYWGDWFHRPHRRWRVLHHIRHRERVWAGAAVWEDQNVSPTIQWNQLPPL